MKSTSLLNAFFALVASVSCVRYEPNWKSLDSRPLPSWYDEGKVGIFLHWGVFSVPSFGSEWFWELWKGPKPVPGVVEFMQENYRPDFTYADFAPMLKAEFFDPNQWAEIFKAAGARYVVLTSKHHEGFTLWPSKVSWNWNAKDVGPNRDLVGDLANAIRKNTDIHFGVYHSLFEWFNPLFLKDQANNFTTQEFVARKTLPELYELVNTYKPEVIWSDGDWMTTDVYWNATEFLAWLYNDSPVKDTVCVNDRWGSNIRCHHGGFLDCSDKYNPDSMPKRKWEDNMSIDRYSWGYRRTALISDLFTVNELVALLAKTVSLGGNLLINVGPTAYGMIDPAYEERLRGMGQWLERYGEAIYSTHPWIHQNDTVTKDIWYTSRNYSSEGEVVYAISLQWYGGRTLHLGGAQPGTNTTVRLLGTSQVLPFVPSQSGGLDIQVPHFPLDQISTPGHAWVFRLDFLQNRRK